MNSRQFIWLSGRHHWHKKESSNLIAIHENLWKINGYISYGLYSVNISLNLRITRCYSNTAIAYDGRILYIFLVGRLKLLLHVFPLSICVLFF